MLENLDERHACRGPTGGGFLHPDIHGGRRVRSSGSISASSLGTAAWILSAIWAVLYSPR